MLNSIYKINSLGWIVEKYINSRQYSELAESTKQRNNNLKRILNHPLPELNLSELAALPVDKINKPLFHFIAEARLTNYQASGRKGQVQVNREITFISCALRWAINYVFDLPISENPLSKFIKIKEIPNKRYVTDKEYDIQFSFAQQIADYLPPVFELTYLLALRGIETLDIKLSDCLEVGIRTHRRKGSKDNIILWSDRLRAAHKLALERHKQFTVLSIDSYLIVGFTGGQLSKSTLDDAMQRLKQLMKKKGLSHVFWSLHKLKSKAVSDSENKHIAGHRSEAMRQRYDVKIHTVKPVR